MKLERGLLATLLLAAVLVYPHAALTAQGEEEAITSQAAGSPIEVERRRDGFAVDGQPYLDPAGPIVDFATDPHRGIVFYLVDQGEGEAQLKKLDVRSGQPAKTVGTVRAGASGVVFEPKQGQRLSGYGVRVTSNGLALLREGSVAVFDADRGMTSAAVPPGYHVAEFQNGDVAGTRHILIERDRFEGPPAQQLLGQTAELARAVTGRSENSYDYGLLNIDSGKVVPLNIAASRNDTGFAYGCIPRSTVTRQCLGWVRYESIFNPDGRPNYSHYYWSLTWLPSRFGPVAVAIEDGLKELNVVQLDSGDRTRAVRRWAGIQYLTVEPLPQGDLQLNPHWSFRAHPKKLSEVLGQPSS